jgi:hypothetical protein
MLANFEIVDEKKVLFKRDRITLVFEVESNLKDTTQSMEISKAVSDYVAGFQGAKLMNVAVHYEWNKEQEVKQSEEFLKANPNYGKKNGKSENSESHQKKFSEKKESETEVIMRKMKNGK